MSGGAAASGLGALVGRRRELARLGDLLARARRGVGVVAVVEGEAGIGKTRLLEALVATSGEQWDVARGRGWEGLEGRSYGLLADALGDVVLGARGAEEILGHVEDRARRGPVALVLDDLQWADAGSLVALPWLLPRLAPLQVAVFAGLRPYPRRREVDALVDAVVRGGGTNVLLEPLDPQEVDDLVAALVGGPPGRRLAALAARAGGNPLMVVEIVRALQDAGALAWVDQHVEALRTDLPPTLTATLHRRLRALPEPTVEALHAAAILGTSFPAADLATVLGATGREVVARLRPAIDAGLLADEPAPNGAGGGVAGTLLTFRHDVIREAITGALPVPLQAQLHLEAGRALAAAGRPPAVVAGHLRRGAAVGDRDAVEWLAKAAREAGPAAPAVACELLEHAVQLVQPPDPAAGQLRAELVTHLVWAGRRADAGRVAAETLLLPLDPASEGLVRLGLARSQLMDGRLRDCVGQVEAAADVHGMPSGDRAELLAEASLGRLLCGDLREAADLASAAEELGRSADRVVAVTAALSTRAWLASHTGRVPDAVALGRSAVAQVVGADAATAAQRHPHFFHGVLLLDADRPDEATRVLEQGRWWGERIGTLWHLPLYHWAFAIAHYQAGRWGDAGAELEAGLGVVEDVATRVGMLWTYGFLGHIALHRNEFGDARRWLDLAREEMEVTGGQFGFDWVLADEAMLAEAQGQVPEALALARLAWETDEELGVVSEHRLLGPLVVRLALAAGDEALAREAAAGVRRAADRTGVGSFEVAALRCEGLVGRDADALLAAVERARGIRRRLDHAAACEDAGTLLLSAASARERALGLLEEATSVYDRMGAAHDTARVEATMRSAGLRRGRRGARRRAVSGPASLTETERKVVALAVEGLTNGEIGRRLYISRRTVETHLSHVFGKLAVSSRSELRDALSAAAARPPCAASDGS